MRRLISSATGLILLGAVTACGDEGQTQASPSYADLAEVLPLSDASTGGQPKFEYLEDTLPNMRLRINGSASRPISPPGWSLRLARVSVVDVETGRGVVDSDGNSPLPPDLAKNVPFDDENANWRTIEITLNVTDPLGPPLPFASEEGRFVAELIGGDPEQFPIAVTRLEALNDALVGVIDGPSGFPLVQRIIPIRADGSFDFNEDESTPLRYSTITGLAQFARGRGEVLVYETPAGDGRFSAEDLVRRSPR